MIYGMYRSAAGVMTANYRQAVIANNLANVETTGFKKDLAITQQRAMAAQELPTLRRFHDRFYDQLGGGTLVSPTYTDASQGSLDVTGRSLDAAIVGPGYFVVERDGQRMLTRNGNFELNSNGQLMLDDGNRWRVLSANLSPIVLDPLAPTEINAQGQIVQRGVPVAQLAVKSAESASLEKAGGHTLSLKRDAGGSDGVARLPDSTLAVVRGGALERSNVDPTTELTAMIEAQRLLEANANLIRYQDQTLGRLVNDVGKV